jgi:glutathione-specific gamma-glutamylcyclotransferase
MVSCPLILSIKLRRNCFDPVNYMPHRPPQLIEINDVSHNWTALEASANDQWVFGYGSLMWAPGFEFRLCIPALVQGWHRQFSLRSTKGWGTDERPGLCAALHEGGSVLGLAFSIPKTFEEDALIGLDRREAAYLRKEVTFALPNKKTCHALTYVVDRANGRFLEDPTRAEQVQHVRQGAGSKGTSLFYLENTVRILDHLGSEPCDAHALLDEVKACSG